MCSSYVCTSRPGEGEGDCSEEREGGDAVTVMQVVSYCLLEQTAHSTSDCLLQILSQLVPQYRSDVTSFARLELIKTGTHTVIHSIFTTYKRMFSSDMFLKSESCYIQGIGIQVFTAAIAPFECSNYSSLGCFIQSDYCIMGCVLPRCR